MTFIEELFHIAPDGGDGRLEITFLLVFVALIVAVLIGIYAKRRRTFSR